AHALKGDCERCLSAGMDQYISKPLQAEEVLEMIARVTHAETPTAATVPAAETPALVAETGELRASSVDLRQDLETLVKRFEGNPQLAQDVSEAFSEEYPPLMAQIHDAIDRQDAPSLLQA